MPDKRYYTAPAEQVADPDIGAYYRPAIEPTATKNGAQWKRVGDDQAGKQPPTEFTIAVWAEPDAHDAIAALEGIGLTTSPPQLQRRPGGPAYPLDDQTFEGE